MKLFDDASAAQAEKAEATDIPVPVDSRELALSATDEFEERSGKNMILTFVGVVVGALFVLGVMFGTVNGKPFGLCIAITALIMLGFLAWRYKRADDRYAATMRVELKTEVVPLALVEEHIELGVQERAPLLAMPMAVDQAKNFVGQIRSGLHELIDNGSDGFLMSLTDLVQPKPPPGTPLDTEPAPEG